MQQFMEKPMCGRAYETYSQEELEMRYLNDSSKRRPLRLSKNYNMAPTQMSPIVLEVDGERHIEMMRWGLIPSWAKRKEDVTRYSMFNARGEEILEKRTYKAAFLQRRCIVPLSGFYEWKTSGKVKTPHRISRVEDPFMSVAGIWESWEDKELGQTIQSFSMLTTSANALMKDIHQRMPVILPLEKEGEWLNSSNVTAEGLTSLLVPCPSEWLEAVEVDSAVGSVKNNYPELLIPVGRA